MKKIIDTRKIKNIYPVTILILVAVSYYPLWIKILTFFFERRYSALLIPLWR